MLVEIIDVHSYSNEGHIDSDIHRDIISGLSLPPGQRQLPTMLLYDAHGLKLYDDITTEATEYYLFAAEEEILSRKADEIVNAMHYGKRTLSGEAVVELGAGALRKTSHVLLSLSRLVREEDPSPPITYFALDLEQPELERTLTAINLSDIGLQLEGKVVTKGMWGTYDDGLKFIQNGGLDGGIEPSECLTSTQGDLRVPSPISSGSSSYGSESLNGNSSPEDGTRPPLHIMFLGSSLGNFSRPEAASFLKSLPLRPGHGDTLLLGLDHDNDKRIIELAYNDAKGYTKRFIFNGLKAAGRALGDETIFDEEKWEYVNYYNITERESRHEAFFKSKCKQEIQSALVHNIVFQQNEMVKIEHSLKFSDGDAYSMFITAELRPIQRWTDSNSQYSLWLLERPPFTFPLLSSSALSNSNQITRQYSKTPFGVPSREDWRIMWTTWDFISQKMIPPIMLYQKPIDLRHICLFYLGHIPTFLDMNLSRLLEEPHTEPKEFKDIFERGIDPNVDNPDECHAHSVVPIKDEDWPDLTAILEFKRIVRARLLKVYDDIDSGKLALTRNVARVLFMTIEHEAMHSETLLYMLIQRAGTGTIPPAGFVPPPWDTLRATWGAAPPPISPTATLGPATVIIGHDDDDALDDTNPKCQNDENHELGWDIEHPARSFDVGQFQISWRPITNGELYQFYNEGGNDKIDFPASWVREGEEIMVRTMYGPVSMDVAHGWPVLTSYDTLSTYATVRGGRLPTEAELRLFFDKFDSGYEGGSNVGFRNWHPVPATCGGERFEGKGTNGGVWEWTSTLLDKVEGYKPSRLYPGYSRDFLDGKHHVVLGGSYATAPRIAERRSFRNWFQHNYPYAWIGGRIVYDISHY